jgi:LmbE family N-acetylglucosaminyl deacetylase
MTRDPAASDVSDSLYVSPHGDDVLLSCAARLLSELAEGLRVTVVTVFGAGGGPRHAANEAAFDRLGVRRITLGLPEASARQASYAAFESLTGRSHPDDAGVTGTAAEALADLGHRSRARQVYVPLGVGAHVDHRLCHEAALRCFESGDGRNVFLYEDRPEAFVRGAVRMRLGHLGARLPPGAVRAADDTSLAAFLLRFHVGPSLRGDLKGWGERARGARVAARLWREARSWRPGKGLGPRLQPVIHPADSDALPAVRALVSESAASARAGERMAILASRYGRRLGAADHAERLWLLLPDHAGSGTSSSAFHRSGSWSQSVLR